jgi:hypothetical protein
LTTKLEKNQTEAMLDQQQQLLAPQRSRCHMEQTNFNQLFRHFDTSKSHNPNEKLIN